MERTDLIDSYLEGKMEEAEMLVFEQEMSKDLSLREEVEFQRGVVDALKDARKDQLKAMLNQVEVGGTATINHFKYLVATVSLLALLGVGSLFYFNGTSQKVTKSETQAAELIEDNIKENSPSNLESVFEASEEQASDNAAKNDALDQVEQIENIAVEQSVNQANKQDLAVAEETIDVKKSAPQFERPSAIGQFESDNNINNTLEMPSPGTTSKATVNEYKNIEIETDNTRRKYSFHYQFKGNKLHLYGTFDQGLYEILAFNSNESRQLYLYYAEQFYAIDESQSKISALKPITDKKFVQKLITIKENKQ